VRVQARQLRVTGARQHAVDAVLGRRDQVRARRDANVVAVEAATSNARNATSASLNTARFMYEP
jgi:hypothetical protein